MLLSFAPLLLAAALATGRLPETAPFAMPLQTAANPVACWQFLPAAQVRPLGQPRLRPRTYRVVRLDMARMKQALTATAAGTATTLLLPLPDGTQVRYQMRATQVMAPALAARYPQLQTYAGQEVGQPANDVRLELTPAGLRAMLIRGGRTFFIEPYRPKDTRHYLCFAQDALPAGSKAGFEVPGK